VKEQSIAFQENAVTELFLRIYLVWQAICEIVMCFKLFLSNADCSFWWTFCLSFSTPWTQPLQNHDELDSIIHRTAAWVFCWCIAI